MKKQINEKTYELLSDKLVKLLPKKINSLLIENELNIDGIDVRSIKYDDGIELNIDIPTDNIIIEEDKKSDDTKKKLKRSLIKSTEEIKKKYLKDIHHINSVKKVYASNNFSNVTKRDAKQEMDKRKFNKEVDIDENIKVAIECGIDGKTFTVSSHDEEEQLIDGIKDKVEQLVVDAIPSIIEEIMK